MIFGEINGSDINYIRRSGIGEIRLGEVGIGEIRLGEVGFGEMEFGEM